MLRRMLIEAREIRAFRKDRKEDIWWRLQEKYFQEFLAKWSFFLNGGKLKANGEFLDMFSIFTYLFTTQSTYEHICDARGKLNEIFVVRHRILSYWRSSKFTKSDQKDGEICMADFEYLLWAIQKDSILLRLRLDFSRPSGELQLNGVFTKAGIGEMLEGPEHRNLDMDFPLWQHLFVVC